MQEKFFFARTGFLIIDASIACLRSTGKLNNKLRMVVASFFCKNLLQPWMDGEKFFAYFLEDYDEKVNKGNWIWCSQIKFDNQIFIRFFNPDLQLKKILKTDYGEEWFKIWKQKEFPKIIDWKQSCDNFRIWKRKVSKKVINA